MLTWKKTHNCDFYVLESSNPTVNLFLAVRMHYELRITDTHDGKADYRVYLNGNSHMITERTRNDKEVMKQFLAHVKSDIKFHAKIIQLLLQEIEAEKLAEKAPSQNENPALAQPSPSVLDIDSYGEFEDYMKHCEKNRWLSGYVDKSCWL